jgi:hypothetical protein
MENQALKTKAEIAATEAANYPKEFGKLNLAHIRSNVEDILKLIGRDGIFHEYTLHDITHVDAMLESLKWLIPKETIKIMTPADWLLIVLACYFHDLGLLVTIEEYKKREASNFPKFRDEVLLEGDIGIDYKDALSYLNDEEREKFYYQEFVRYNHAERIYYWIKGQARESLGASHKTVDAINTLLDGLGEKLREDLALICRSHHYEDLDQIDSVYVLRRAYGQPEETHANLQYCALLLRTADLLQIRRNRTPAIMLKLIDPTNPKSQNEWAKQAQIRAILPTKSDFEKNGSDDTIEVQAEFTEASGFFGLTAYLQYVQTELKQSYEWCKQANAKGAKHEFPWQYIDDNQVETKGFLPKKYEFLLDRKKILDLLTGHTLYNDATVAIREILQNSIDAVRFQKHLKTDEPLGSIQVHWNSQTKLLEIRDNGTGMTQETIVKNFLNVGSSYYQQKKFKEKYPEFSPISQFGIGVLSYFMISNNIEILSVHPDEEMAHQISLPSATQRYLIKTLPKDHKDVKSVGPHGTQVRLVVRPSAKLKEIEKILRYWIVLPKCAITLTEDGGAPKKIGFDNPKDALTFYIKQDYSDTPIKQNIDIKQSDSTTGINLAYAIRFLRWFKVWHLLTRGRLSRSIRSTKDPLQIPPGVCVEGIRVSSEPPGYSIAGPWALANLSGVNAPRTNVVRSDLEQSKELKTTYAVVYKILGNHICEEFERIAKSGGGITKASTEANFMMSGLRDSALDKKEIENCIDSLPIFTIEESSGRKIVSRKKLQEFETLWTVDSLLIDRLDGLCESMDVNYSSAEIIKRLTGRDTHGIYFPRIIGQSNDVLHGFEIKSILIDLEDMSITLEWAKEAGRWCILSDEEFGELERMRSRAIWDINMNIIFARLHVECSKPEINWIIVRNTHLFLQSCPITLLWDLFADKEKTALRWIAELMNQRCIIDDHIPRLREDLKDIGKNPVDILPKLVIKDEMIFDMNSVLRRNKFGF